MLRRTNLRRTSHPDSVPLHGTREFRRLPIQLPVSILVGTVDTAKERDWCAGRGHQVDGEDHPGAKGGVVAGRSEKLAAMKVGE